MKRNALSVTAIVFLGLFLLASAFIFVFERQLVSYSAPMETDAFFSTPFVVPWESAVLIAAAVFEIVFAVKGGKRFLSAAVPLAALILGRIMETVQLKLAMQSGIESVTVISIVNSYSIFVDPLFLIGSGFLFVCAFSDYASKKLFYTGIVFVSVAAAAVIVLLFPISAAKAVNAAGYIVSAGLLILTAVKKTTVVSVVSGIFCVLNAAARPFIAALTRYFAANLFGEKELLNFSIFNIYLGYAGFVLTVGAVMILAYCAANNSQLTVTG